jgi:hypothetical protein
MQRQKNETYEKSHDMHHVDNDILNCPTIYKQWLHLESPNFCYPITTTNHVSFHTAIHSFFNGLEQFHNSDIWMELDKT